MKMKKLSACALAATLSIACLAGCNGSGGGLTIEESKSQLNVGVFKAGVGTTWLTNSIKDFEEYYANVSFEEGKTGVQVVPEDKTEEFKGSNLSATMPYNETPFISLNSPITICSWRKIYWQTLPTLSMRKYTTRTATWLLKS